METFQKEGQQQLELMELEKLLVLWQGARLVRPGGVLVYRALQALLIEDFAWESKQCMPLCR